MSPKMRVSAQSGRTSSSVSHSATSAGLGSVLPARVSAEDGRQSRGALRSRDARAQSTVRSRSRARCLLARSVSSRACCSDTEKFAVYQRAHAYAPSRAAARRPQRRSVTLAKGSETCQSTRLCFPLRPMTNELNQLCPPPFRSRRELASFSRASVGLTSLGPFTRGNRYYS